MKKILFIIKLFIFSINSIYSQIFDLKVIGGYGSGSYQVGDTVHIWSEAYDNTKTFSHWKCDTHCLEKPNEWHTTLIMPNHNISVTSVVKNMPSYNLNYEQLMGVNNMKNVYSCFPSGMKGVVYLFHGTGGNASNWINTVEYRSFVNAAIADSYGIIVTEAEEITLNTDLNGDGKLRWQAFPIDTINGIDYLNIKAITDTYIIRGYINSATPKFSVGMSNGGSFSAAISYVYNYQAGISYCASSAQAIFKVRSNPFAFRMAKYDDNAEVGTQGNYEAWQNDSILKSRSICHDYEIHDRQPIYPERFARISGISIATSKAIFNELKHNNQLDRNHYSLHSDTIMNHVLKNPALYPSITSLSGALRKEVLNQISTSNAEHKFYSDYNFETLDYFNHLCSPLTHAKKQYTSENGFTVFPNPANSVVNIRFFESVADYKGTIYNSLGKLVKSFQNKFMIEIDDLLNGIYFLKIETNSEIVWQKIIKTSK